MKLRGENWNRFRESFESFALTFIIGVTATLLILLFPLILIVSAPIFISRALVSKCSKWGNPKLAEMVAARSVIFAVDSLYTKPKNTIVNRLVWKEPLNLEQVRNRVNEGVIHHKLANNGGAKYPEMTQHLTTWMGFNFWQRDEDFRIENHVKERKKETELVYTDEEANEVMTELLQKPWVKGRPLWEIVLLQNCKLEGLGVTGTVMFLRIHHTLGDGYSIMKMVYNDIIGVGTSSATPSYTKRSSWSLFFYVLAFPLRCSFEMAESMIMPFIPWVSIPFSCRSERQTGVFNIDISSKISLQQIREVREHFGVTFSSVLLSIAAGVMREIMIKKGHSIPPKYQFFLPMPLPGHPPKMINYFSFGVTVLPVREKDPVERLRICGEEYRRLKDSTFPVFSKYYIYLVGSYLPPISRLLVRHSTANNIFTNFSGGFDSLAMNGNRLIDIIFLEGPTGHSALTFCILSYVDVLRISTIADASVMNKKDVKEVTNLFQKYLSILHDKIVGE